MTKWFPGHSSGSIIEFGNQILSTMFICQDLGVKKLLNPDNQWGERGNNVLTLIIESATYEVLVISQVL